LEVGILALPSDSIIIIIIIIIMVNWPLRGAPVLVCDGSKFCHKHFLK
jgi:hypothetical protein